MELTGLSRSHVVDNFLLMLQSHMTVVSVEVEVGEDGAEVGGEEWITIPVAGLKDSLHTLSCEVLAREKECYHL